MVCIRILSLIISLVLHVLLSLVILILCLILNLLLLLIPLSMKLVHILTTDQRWLAFKFSLTSVINLNFDPCDVGAVNHKEELTREENDRDDAETE